MTIADAYSEWARHYDSDRNLTRDLDGEVTRTIVGSGPIPVLVEAGCGTGKNTAYYATVAGQVFALDFSPGMLDVARRTNVSSNVRFEQADLSADWPCPSQSADLVCFNLVLEHIEDIAGVMQRAAGVLRPGGRIFVSELHPFKQYQGSQARFVNAEGIEIKVPAFRHDVSEYLDAGRSAGVRLARLAEWWHPEDDRGGGPRLITFVFQRDDGPPSRVKRP